MQRYLKTLNTVKVYADHSQTSQIIKTYPQDEFIPFNREKLRNGINWIEIYLDNAKKGYLLKNKQDLFICKYAELRDDEALGFDYEYDTIGGKKLSFSEIFDPVQVNEMITPENYFESKKARVEVKRTDNKEKNKTETIILKYDPNFVRVVTFTMQEKEMFYVTYDNSRGDDAFIKIDNLLGKKGYLLNSTFYTEPKDDWIGYVGTTAGILTVVAMMFSFYLTGWLVITGLYIIPAAIVGFIVILVLKVIVKILAKLYHQIRIRF